MKIIDEVSIVRGALGTGLIREEVWVDQDGIVAAYNLAYIQHLLFSSDNGRVLGYDNAHGHHHRHFRGVTAPYPYRTYPELLSTFLAEVDELKLEQA